MCDPLTIAGIALTGASVAANKIASNQVSAARKSAVQAELERQRGFDRESNAINAQSLGRFGDFSGQEGQKAKSLGDYFVSQNTPVSTAQSAQGAPAESAPSSNNIVNQEVAKQLGKTKAYSDQQGQALGNLRAFGDVMGDIGVGQARDFSKLGTINGFRAGSSGVLPLELSAANNKGGLARMFGDIAGGAGSLATMGGLSGMFSGASATAPSAASMWGGSSDLGFIY